MIDIVGKRFRTENKTIQKAVKWKKMLIKLRMQNKPEKPSDKHEKPTWLLWICRDQRMKPLHLKG